jgi:lysophospholipase L1-like esterase
MMLHRKNIQSIFIWIVCFFVQTAAVSCNKKIDLPNVFVYNAPVNYDTSHTAPIDSSFIPSPSNDTAVNSYLALGDSYTIGESVADTDRFPNQVAQLLRNAGIKISDPKIIATTGWTTGNLISALNTNPPQTNYSLVSLLIGVNNQYQGRSIDEYKTEFTLLLNKAIQYAGNKKTDVFVLSIPDYSVTPFASHSNREKISREIDEFNKVNEEISSQSGVNYLDITGISREASDDSSLIANDGLHPSGKQYKKWAELLAPIMKSHCN